MPEDLIPLLKSIDNSLHTIVTILLILGVVYLIEGVSR